VSATPNPVAAGDPFSSFRADHGRLLARLDELERRLPSGASIPDEPALFELVEVLERQFATHMAAEDAILFPALDDAFPVLQATLEPLREDHLELRLMLATLAEQLSRQASPARAEQIVVLARDLTDLLRLHVHREETAVFDVAQRALTPQETTALADRLAPYLDTLHPGTPEPGFPKGSTP
jgi:hemerythrin-like domain-containing protein